MRTTDGATALPTNSQASHSQGRSGDQGVIALEWLLIIGAVAGLAASSVLTVQRVVDDTAEVSVEPGVRFLDAEIAATHIANEATAWRVGLVGDPYFWTFQPDSDYDGYEQRCEGALPAAFDDVVSSARWRRPQEYDEDHNFGSIALGSLSPEDLAKYNLAEIKEPASCDVTFRAGLGG